MESRIFGNRGTNQNPRLWYLYLWNFTPHLGLYIILDIITFCLLFFMFLIVSLHLWFFSAGCSTGDDPGPTPAGHLRIHGISPTTTATTTITSNYTILHYILDVFKTNKSRIYFLFYSQMMQQQQMMYQQQQMYPNYYVWFIQTFT